MKFKEIKQRERERDVRVKHNSTDILVRKKKKKTENQQKLTEEALYLEFHVQCQNNQT